MATCPNHVAKREPIQTISECGLCPQGDVSVEGLARRICESRKMVHIPVALLDTVAKFEASGALML
jgi:hypothetical protein